nr:MAG TPA: hypothetical protein [Caudoviricetes sp.]
MARSFCKVRACDYLTYKSRLIRLHHSPFVFYIGRYSIYAHQDTSVKAAYTFA